MMKPVAVGSEKMKTQVDRTAAHRDGEHEITQQQNYSGRGGIRHPDRGHSNISHRKCLPATMKRHGRQYFDTAVRRLQAASTSSCASLLRAPPVYVAFKAASHI